jgi:hypothetical protein
MIKATKRMAGRGLVDVEYIRRCLKLTAYERLRELEALNGFLFKAMSHKSKQVWVRLKEQGW